MSDESNRWLDHVMDTYDASTLCPRGHRYVPMDGCYKCELEDEEVTESEDWAWAVVE